MKGIRINTRLFFETVKFTTKVFIFIALITLFLSIPNNSHADTLNAYHPEQMSSAAIAAGIDSCMTGVRKSTGISPKRFPETASRPYCSCSMDWMENRGIQGSHKVLPPLNVLSICAKKASKYRAIYPLKNSFSSKKMPSDTVWQWMNYCQNQYAERLAKTPTLKVPTNISLYHCSCMSDFLRDNAIDATFTIPDSVNHYCAQWALGSTLKKNKER